MILEDGEDRINSILNGLCSGQRLQREREVFIVKKHIGDIEFTSKLIVTILERLTLGKINTERWEALAGLLSAVIHLLCCCNVDQIQTLLSLSLHYLDHEECRVRKESGETLANCLLKLNDISSTTESYRMLVEIITRDLERDQALQNLPENEKIRQKIMSHQVERNKTSQEIFHESAGWRHLETSMNALKRLFELNKNTNLLDQHLFKLLEECSSHTNRFIRESAFYVLSAVLDETLNHTEFIELFSNLIEKGLSDNWSQVRMASSTACRTFLHALDNQKREIFYPSLLPPIALNRYYIAAGVRIHNQETWRSLFPNGGTEYVSMHIGSFVEFYSKQIVADNHAVREAACACIAELAQKCTIEQLEGKWQQMLGLLVDCFEDDSWPVRDAACIASGNFIKVLPAVTKPQHQVLYDKFIQNSTDPIASVRQGGAYALSYLAKAESQYFDKCVAFILECFADLEKQKPITIRQGRLESGPGQFGVVRRITHEEDLIENRTMYSCGSLAPKMKAKKDKIAGTGCSACTNYTRDEYYWERVDGAIHILSSLCKTSDRNREISQKLGEIIDALGETLLRNKGFEQHHILYETAAKQLISISSGLNKQVFKNHLATVFDILFYAATSQVILTRSAAEECFAALSRLLGESILRGRVEMTHSQHLNVLDNALKDPIRVAEHKITGMKTSEDNYGAFISMAPDKIPL